MTENNSCPCCGRHCDLSEPRCDRGMEYLRTGEIPEHRHTEKQEHHGHHGGIGKNFRRTKDYCEMDADSRLVMNLRDLGHMIRFLFEGKGSQKRILILLYETGGMTQRELTEKLGVKPGSASEVIAKLESAGLILRTASETDRRTTDISLTESGRAKAKEAAGQRKTRHQEMFSCLSEEEKDTLLALAEKLNADWDSRYRENDTHGQNDSHERNNEYRHH